MAGIKDFIGMATSQLGIGESTAKAATGGLLQTLQSAAGKGDFQELLDKVPGAERMLSKAPAAGGGGGGGLMGSLAGMAGGLLGGDAGGALGVVSSLTKSGLDAGKIGPFVSLFMGFVKERAGDGLVGKLLGSAPELAKLIR